MSKKYYFLLKVYEKECHANALIDGELFMRPLAEFNKNEDGGVRGDPCEGVVAWLQPNLIYMNVKHIDHSGNEVERLIDSSQIAGPIVESDPLLLDFNVFCLYSFGMDDFKFEYESSDLSSQREARARAEEFLKMQVKKIKKADALGEYGVIIHDVPKFFDLIDSKLANKGFYYSRRHINYINENDGNHIMDFHEAIFTKREIYSYQSEYRIAFRDDFPVSDRKINIGSIASIAQKVKMSEIEELIKFDFIDK